MLVSNAKAHITKSSRMNVLHKVCNCNSSTNQIIQSEFAIPVNAITEYSTSDKNFVGTDFSLLKLLRYNGKHAYRHRQ